MTFNASSLSKIGVETHLIVGKGTGGPVQKILPEYFGIAPSEKLQVHLLPVFKFSSAIFYVLATFKILFLSKQGAVQAVISRDPGFLPYLVLLKKWSGVAAFAECHNYYWETTDDEDMLQVLRQRKKYSSVEQKWLPKLDGLICILTPMAALYKKHLPPEKVHVALPGTLPSKKNYRPEKKPVFYIGYIGSLQAQRDFETLFRALKKIKVPKVKLLIIGGRKKEMPLLKKLMEANQVKDMVEITGWLPYAMVREQMERLSVGLVPMKDNLYNRALTAPMKIMDYLSFGLPILAADLPSAREFVGNDGAGIFYTPGDADKLAEKIDYLATRMDVLSEMAKAARKRAEAMSWENRASLQVDILKGRLEDAAGNL